MDRTEPTTPFWLRKLVWLQIVIALAAIGVAVVAGTQVKPLIEKRNSLALEVAKEQGQVKAYRDQVKNARVAVKYVTDGINLYHAGNYDGAIASYNEALRLDPENPYIYNLKGYSLFKAHRFDQASKTLKQSVELDENYAWGYFDLARSYCAEGKFDEAKQAAAKAIQVQPEIKHVMRKDGEFTHLCHPLVHELFSTGPALHNHAPNR